MSIPTAALLIIGNEILTGRTRDKNLPQLATVLSDIGVAFREARVVPDDTNKIIEALNELRKNYTYVFTSGGIGATHDDITMAAVAKAFGLKHARNPEALKILENHYGGDLTDVRCKMADMPEGCGLIDNPVSLAPGAIVENVFVLAGIPEIFGVMLQTLTSKIRVNGTSPFKYSSVTVMVPENKLAKELALLQESYEGLDIGSYPFFKLGVVGASFVVRGQNIDLINDATSDLIKTLETQNIEYELKKP